MINNVNRDLICSEDCNLHEQNPQGDFIISGIATCFDVHVFSSNWNYACNKVYTSKQNCKTKDA